MNGNSFGRFISSVSASSSSSSTATAAVATARLQQLSQHMSPPLPTQHQQSSPQLLASSPSSSPAAIAAALRNNNNAAYSSSARVTKGGAAREKVAIIGSGNWGMTIARIIGRNVLLHPTEFEPEVQMWVYEETLADGRKLTDVINNDHENPKYLPGKLVPSNVIANPDLVSSAKGATALVFVLPHQFVARTCQDLKKGNVLGANCKAISLIKGFDDSDCTDGHISLISDLIARELGVDVSVLSGANIANEVADEKFCETTIGYRHVQHGAMFQRLFQTPNFHVGMVHDVDGVEICGALKNVVAIAAGLVDGLSYGDNTKAAIIRMGLSEMRKFAYIFATSHGRTISTETFFESCGVADLITTCAGGRNRKVAEAFAKTGRPFAELEKEMLNGQKLQGTLTSNEVYGYLKKHDLLQDFPLFVKVYKVCYEGVPAKAIVSW